MTTKFDEKSCGIVLFKEKDSHREYLLLHYPEGHWDLPKGHVEEGEDERETAARELLEETGIADIRFVEGYREEISYIYQRNGKPSNKQVVFFLAKTDLNDIRLSHEHKGSTWLDADSAFNKATFDNAKNLIKEAENFLNS